MSKQAQTQAKAVAVAAPVPGQLLLGSRPFADYSAPGQATFDQATAERLGHRFGAVGVRQVAPPIVQPKLRFGPAQDEYEREADRVAQQVASGVGAAPGRRRLKEMSPPPTIQRLTAPTTVSSATPGVEAGIVTASRGGQALAAGVRAPMERALGADFADVRIHADRRSDLLNRAVDSYAFTSGRQIFFRRGAYDPSSAAGRNLLAHELTHVVQQAGGAAPGVIQRKKIARGTTVAEVTKLYREGGVTTQEVEEYFALQHDLLTAEEIILSVHPELGAKEYRYTKELAKGYEKEATAPIVNKTAAGPRLRGEEDQNKIVRYLTPQELPTYELKKSGQDTSAESVQGQDDGVFVWKGQPFTTHLMKRELESLAGVAIFVMTDDGKVYVADVAAEIESGEAPEKKYFDRFHHSSFLRGSAVAAAGEVRTDEFGRLVGVTDGSGHYRPELEHTRQFLNELLRRAIDLTGVEVSITVQGGKGQDDSSVKTKKIVLLARDLVEYKGDKAGLETWLSRNNRYYREAKSGVDDFAVPDYEFVTRPRPKDIPQVKKEEPAPREGYKNPLGSAKKEPAPGEGYRNPLRSAKEEPTPEKEEVEPQVEPEDEYTMPKIEERSTKERTVDFGRVIFPSDPHYWSYERWLAELRRLLPEVPQYAWRSLISSWMRAGVGSYEDDIRRFARPFVNVRVSTRGGAA